MPEYVENGPVAGLKDQHCKTHSHTIGIEALFHAEFQERKQHGISGRVKKPAHHQEPNDHRDCSQNVHVVSARNLSIPKTQKQYRIRPPRTI